MTWSGSHPGSPRPSSRPQFDDIVIIIGSSFPGGFGSASSGSSTLSRGMQTNTPSSLSRRRFLVHSQPPHSRWRTQVKTHTPPSMQVMGAGTDGTAGQSAAVRQAIVQLPSQQTLSQSWREVQTAPTRRLAVPVE